MARDQDSGNTSELNRPIVRATLAAGVIAALAALGGVGLGNLLGSRQELAGERREMCTATASEFYIIHTRLGLLRIRIRDDGSLRTSAERFERDLESLRARQDSAMSAYARWRSLSETNDEGVTAAVDAFFVVEEALIMVELMDPNDPIAMAKVKVDLKTYEQSLIKPLIQVDAICRVDLVGLTPGN